MRGSIDNEGVGEQEWGILEFSQRKSRDQAEKCKGAWSPRNLSVQLDLYVNNRVKSIK